jgi:pyruvate dehydrogenase (quinone)
MARTCAELLVERLIAWGVDTIFGFPGDGIGEILEVLRRNQERLRFIQVRHEEAAAFAACGYAKFTGRLGVCLATSGPGGIHLANGLYDAKGDDQPVLALTGHTWHHLIGTHYQQDVALDKLFMDVAAYSERVMGPDHVIRVVDEAIKLALSRRTVAHITIPRDIQKWPASDDAVARVAPLQQALLATPPPLPPPALLEQAADLINAGTRVAIMAGRGALHARAEVLQLAERVAGPIIKPLLGKAVVPDDSPYTTGGMGLLGTAPSQEALEACDTLVIIGSGFPYLDFYPKPGQARTVQIDIDPARLGLRHPTDVGLVGDSREVLRALLPLLHRKEDRRFLQRAQEHMARWNRLLEERGTRLDRPLKPQVVFYQLNKLLADDAIITCDSGTSPTWVARYLHLRDRMQFTLSGTLSTMACALPYSIGAAVAYPGRQVLCVAGDGGFTMLMGEVATLVKYQLPVKMIVVKNNTLDQVRWEQLVQMGYPEFGVDLQPIDFAAFARACGAAGYTLDDPAQTEGVLRAALAHPGPALVEAVVDPNEPPLPGKITMQQALLFAEALAKGERDRWALVRDVVTSMVRDAL